MPVVPIEKLVGLLREPDRIRNICILGHVDHGKTSLTDCLIATNGIISTKLAGKVRYLDSREDEQERGITMESSGISLYFDVSKRLHGESKQEEVIERHAYVVNLIDSPGHIDFSSEVSIASRLCDGAVVLVDAVEGVCSQTVSVLRQTWMEKFRCILAVNKVDRLITELRMTPREGYDHLARLIEQVNAVIGGFELGERMAQESDTFTDHESDYFAPEKDNVIFCSALDGWAFTVKQFAGLYEKKLGMKRSVLETVLWGPYYIDAKAKCVLTQKQLKGRPLKPAFVQMVLEPIWAVYDATIANASGKPDHERLQKITASLGITLSSQITRTKNYRNILTTLFNTWLPLSTAMLISIIEQLPSPATAQAVRLPEIISALPRVKQSEAWKAMVNCSRERSVPVIAFVSKMLAISESDIVQHSGSTGGRTSDEIRELARQKRNELRELAEHQKRAGVDGAEDIVNTFGTLKIGNEGHEEKKDEAVRLIGFTRVYSGELRVMDEVYIVPPRYDADDTESPQPKKARVTGLYMMMGRALERLEAAPAGSIVGVEGLDEAVLKYGTLCSSQDGLVNLARVSEGVKPIVRIALEPVNPGDMDKMIKGIEMLVQADSCVEYEVLDSGEHVLCCAGELHIERCVKDMRERFAKCEIQYSEPIVPYRESIVAASEMNPPKNKELGRGTVVTSVGGHGGEGKGEVTIRLRVVPLPACITGILEECTELMKRLKGSQIVANTAEEELRRKLEVGFASLKVTDGDETWKNALMQIVCFGPRQVGANILFDRSPKKLCRKLFEQHECDNVRTRGTKYDLFEDKVKYAFQLATAQGPLCREPIQGIGVIIEEFTVNINHGPGECAGENDGMVQISRELIRPVREAIYGGFLDWSARLMLATHACVIQTSSDVLGRVYGVVTRRRGRIVAESMMEGTSYLRVEARIPVVESMGFAKEIRQRTSGAANPQLVFAGFEMLDEDPFWVPFTEEDLEDLGELAERANVAKMYMDEVRTKKGLAVSGKKLVENAEKQKTLKR